MPRTRWSRRHKITFGIEEPSKWDGNHRVPPKPKHYYTKTKGNCRWCGMAILGKDDELNMRKSWHENCVDEYMFIYHPRETRKVVLGRDGGICNWCSSKTKGFHVDHIKPLVEQKGKDVSDLDYSYWSLSNLQTLCPQCHSEKTGEEATNRAKSRKKKTKYKPLQEFIDLLEK